MKLAERVSQLNPSITLAITAKANAMKAEGIDVVAFGAGEPDFNTPLHIQEAAIKAMRDGMTRYTPSSGIMPLRKAVAEDYEARYGVKYSPKNVVISCGGKHSLYNIFQVVLDRGDQVLIPAPYWVSYPEMICLAEAEPVIIPTTEATGFRVTVEQLKEYTTDRTRMLILNSPSNPTGAAYDKADLEKIAEFAIENDLLVISDEIYEHMVYDGFQFTCFASLGEELRERVIVVSGASKTYAMTGWRIGWAVGPNQIMEMVDRLQSQSTSNPTSFAQYGAVAALKGPQDCIKEMIDAFAGRRRYIVDRLRSMDGIECHEPEGAFYVFPKTDAYYHRQEKVVDSLSLADYLLEKVRVAVIPGIGFGQDANIRLSYATSMEQIEKGLDRIAQALCEL